MTTETSSSSVVPSVEPNPTIHHLGYRGWSGHRESSWFRWMVIASVGIRRSWQNQWLKRMLFFAWLPAVSFGICFFLWEQAALYPDWRHLLHPLFRALPRTPVFDEIRHSMETGDLASNRHIIWAWLLHSFFLYPQAVLMVLLIGLIAPPLISQDIRSRAFLLYFSRPLTRTEYIIGKMASVCAYLALISLVPALVLYVLGVVLSPSLTVVNATWDLPLRIMLASVVLMIPTSALALSFSSLTQETRYAGFAWFAIWILGWFTYIAVSSAEAFNTHQRATRHNRIFAIHESAWTHLSLYHTLGRVQSWVFGFEEFGDVAVSVAILVVVTTVSLGVMYHRISAPMRV